MSVEILKNLKNGIYKHNNVYGIFCWAKLPILKHTVNWYRYLS